VSQPLSNPQNRIVAHYEACLAEHGDTHRGVDWPNQVDAQTRYRVMLDGIRTPPGQPIRLLDLGCGAGHLYDFLLRHPRPEITYQGLDLSERFIALCRQKHPHLTWICGDILTDEDLLSACDYVVMNGVFTEKREATFDEMLAYFQAVVGKVFAAVEMGIAFNVMSKQVDWERDDLFHLPLDTLARFLTQNVSRHFVIRNDYGLYEYTTYVYK
jgi:SAM-dependent methyltransferase